jgi:hypothetical protein
MLIYPSNNLSSGLTLDSGMTSGSRPYTSMGVMEQHYRWNRRGATYTITVDSEGTYSICCNKPTRVCIGINSTSHLML